MPQIENERRSVLNSRPLALLVLALFALVFLFQAAPRIDAPFGDSHDGENGAVWGLASRSLRESGFAASRGGAALGATEGVYAHHPPGIIWETATFEAVLGEHSWSTRAPAWVGSLAAIALVYSLLVTLGTRRVVSALAVVLVLSSTMFLVYGTMLDTLQIALPVTLAYLLCRARANCHKPVSPWLEGLLACAVTLASWEGWLICAGMALLDLRARWPRDGLRRVSPTAWGAACGAALTGAWLWWANGSWSVVVEQAFLRTGVSGQHVGWFDFIDLQWTYLGANIGILPILVGASGIALALSRRWHVGFTCVVAGTTVLYPLAFRNGATNHDYWNYWLLIPLVIGAGYALDHLIDWVDERFGSALLGATTAATVGVVLLVTTLTSSNPAAARFDLGLHARDLALRISRGHPGEPWAVTGDFGVTDVRWANYSLARGTRFDLLTPDDVQRDAARSPDEPVLVKCVPLTPAYRKACAEHSGAVYFTTALGTLAGELRDPAPAAMTRGFAVKH